MKERPIPLEMVGMKKLYPLAVLLLSSLSMAPSFADEVVKTYPPGSAKDVLEKGDKDAENPVGQAGGAMVVDEDCAKRTAKGAKLNSGRPNPEYEACVKKKLDAQKKKH